MEENKNYLESYESVSKEVKYLTNSLVRLKLLATLYEQPLNMKDINSTTGLSYSSISSNMHDLELDGYVYRHANKYFLSNSAKLQIDNVLELNYVIMLLNEFFNILDKHLVDMIPNQSIAEFYLLGKANLIESDGVDVYRIYKYIADVLNAADSAKCVLPFYHEVLNEKLNDLVCKKKEVEIIISDLLVDIFKEKSKVNSLLSFKGENNFLLIVTNQMMILGLFKEDGFFDQNRLLTSKNQDSINWANNLYENFKNEKINEF
ncbi:ArsR family transcriptional regulator [Methanobrevibacter sp. YE315]|uniref:helix-turn-helix transcriptional regulator n=1 Tax=Methanobrevibacter sp. YE315 TaxID=1609968 RepID=UPI000764D4CE|nr:transcriptional regulator FilR1 domain-containing protein [Methanobrevibacter sp. YE315]AMD17061.1 ArsR family transcriptional regulator [Methanobrevibacter sp. YE315]